VDEVSVHLLVIDPQQDFVSPRGSLTVPGADADMDRLAAWVDAHAAELDAITVTLDQHHVLDISHPQWWQGPSGDPPAPFTRITADDVVAGRWIPRDPGARDRSVAYLRALDAAGRYPHVIWPEHCLIGDPGGTVWPALSAALHRWARARTARVSWVTKGTNPWTEHFSAIRAEVPDPADPGTQVAEGLVRHLSSADRIVVAGEARSHCVANTVRDLVAASPEIVRRIELLADATSDVPGFESLGEAFVRELTARGMALSRTIA
jgi:nicotinamidase-related amidase